MTRTNHVSGGILEAWTPNPFREKYESAGADLYGANSAPVGSGRGEESGIWRHRSGGTCHGHFAFDDHARASRARVGRDTGRWPDHAAWVEAASWRSRRTSPCWWTWRPCWKRRVRVCRMRRCAGTSQKVRASWRRSCRPWDTGPVTAWWATCCTSWVIRCRPTARVAKARSIQTETPSFIT